MTNNSVSFPSVTTVASYPPVAWGHFTPTQENADCCANHSWAPNILASHPGSCESSRRFLDSLKSQYTATTTTPGVPAACQANIISHTHWYNLSQPQWRHWVTWNATVAAGVSSLITISFFSVDNVFHAEDWPIHYQSFYFNSSCLAILLSYPCTSEEPLVLPREDTTHIHHFWEIRKCQHMEFKSFPLKRSFTAGAWTV